VERGRRVFIGWFGSIRDFRGDVFSVIDLLCVIEDLLSARISEMIESDELD